MVAVPNTRTRLSHALTIRSGGRIIGAIHQWSPAMSRDVEAVFEVEQHAVGMPVELIPQNVSRREIRIARYDTYPELMEEVFGTSELITLADQYRPFSCREVWRGPPRILDTLSDISSLANTVGLNGVARASSTVAGAITDLGLTDNRVYEYTGCWFTDLGRTIDAKGDRVISVEATIAYLGRRRVA